MNNREPQKDRKYVVGYEGLYMVSSFGDIKSGHTNIILKPSNSKYKTVSLCKQHIKKTHRVHKIVAMAYLDNPQNKRTVNHKDGDTHNNHVSNLERNTHQENMQHSFNKLNRTVSGCGKRSYENSKRVGLVEDGKIVKERKSVYHASIDTGVSETPIYYVCNHKLKAAKGMVFRYI